MLTSKNGNMLVCSSKVRYERMAVPLGPLGMCAWRGNGVVQVGSGWFRLSLLSKQLKHRHSVPSPLPGNTHARIHVYAPLLMIDLE